MAEVRIEVKCPGCERPFHVPPSEQGKIADCPHCGGWVDVPELSRAPSMAEMLDAAALRNAGEYERQSAEAKNQLGETARQIEQAQRGLDKRDELDVRFENLMGRIDSVVGQWENLAVRMGRVVDRLGG